MMKPLYTKIILTTVGLVLVYFFFLLPKIVVNDEKTIQSSVETTVNTTEETVDEGHLSISIEQEELIADYKEKIRNTDNLENFCKFADSLAEVFYANGFYDSTAFYKNLIYSKIPTTQNKTSLALVLFEAVETYPPKKGELFAGRAKELFEELVTNFPEVEEFKVKLAVLIVKISASEGKPPLEGINMLKQLIEANPSNVLANRHLGEFYMQISSSDPKMLEKAIFYFKNILKVEEDNLRATINLLECNIALNNKVEALGYLSRLKEIIDTSDVFLSSYVTEKEEEVKKL